LSEFKEDWREIFAEAQKMCFLLGAMTAPKIDWIKLVKELKAAYERGKKIR